VQVRQQDVFHVLRIVSQPADVFVDQQPAARVAEAQARVAEDQVIFRHDQERVHVDEDRTLAIPRIVRPRIERNELLGRVHGKRAFVQSVHHKTRIDGTKVQKSWFLFRQPYIVFNVRKAINFCLYCHFFISKTDFLVIFQHICRRCRFSAKFRLLLHIVWQTLGIETHAVSGFSGVLPYTMEKKRLHLPSNSFASNEA